MRNSKVAMRLAAAVAIGAGVILVAWNATSEPGTGSSFNFARELNAAAVSIPEHERAWPIYRTSAGALGAYRGNGPWPARPELPGWDDAVAYIKAHQDHIEGIRTAAALAALGAVLTDAGDAELIAAMARTHGFPPPEPQEPTENPIFATIVYDHLGPLRSAAAAMRTDLHVAVQVRDGDRVLADLRSLAGLARHMAQPPLLAGQSLGYETVVELVHELGRVLARDPDVLSNSHLDEIEMLLASMNAGAPFVPDLDIERLQMTDFVSRAYGTKQTISVDGTILIGAILPFVTAGADDADRMRNAATLEMPEMMERDELLAATDELLRAHSDDLARPLWQRQAPADAQTEHLLGTPRRCLPLRFISPYITQVGVRAAQATFMRDAGLLMLELERVRRTRGAYPNNTGNLQRPADPFDGQPVRYTLTPNGPVLYSVGPDRDDDGGQAGGQGYAHTLARSWDPDRPSEHDGDWVIWSP